MNTTFLTWRSFSYVALRDIPAITNCFISPPPPVPLPCKLHHLPLNSKSSQKNPKQHIKQTAFAAPKQTQPHNTQQTKTLHNLFISVRSFSFRRNNLWNHRLRSPLDSVIIASITFPLFKSTYISCEFALLTKLIVPQIQTCNSSLLFRSTSN